MAPFQAGDGLSFERLEDGSVKIRKMSDGGTIFEQTLDAFSWCSVVTEVALKADSVTHARVEDVHRGY